VSRVPLGLSRRSGKDPVEHRSRTLFGLWWRDHDRPSGGRRQRFRAVDRCRSECCPGATDAADARATGSGADCARSIGAPSRSATASAPRPSPGCAAGDGDAAHCCSDASIGTRGHFDASECGSPGASPSR
jgi:hypothetical protein